MSLTNRQLGLAGLAVAGIGLVITGAFAVLRGRRLLKQMRLDRAAFTDGLTRLVAAGATNPIIPLTIAQIAASGDARVVAGKRPTIAALLGATMDAHCRPPVAGGSWAEMGMRLDELGVGVEIPQRAPTPLSSSSA
jgi:hypothetical protein